MASVRDIWQRIETLHAVTYFAPESIAAAEQAGLRGFWMGYFGFRACPLGAVSPGAVEASFANFAPSMVARAIPDAWSFATPDHLRSVRSEAAAAALNRCVPTIAATADRVADKLDSVIAAASPLGRPLFAANRSVELPVDATERLWQQCTTLREHRGDGHVATLAAAGVDGCEAHLLLAADQGVDPQLFLQHRGWTDEQQNDASLRLRERDLVVDGVLTDAGRRRRADVEDVTDRLAAAPFLDAIGPEGIADLVDALTASATHVVRSEVLPFPNPMGLPPLGDG